MKKEFKVTKKSKGVTLYSYFVQHRSKIKTNPYRTKQTRRKINEYYYNQR